MVYKCVYLYQYKTVNANHYLLVSYTISETTMSILCFILFE